MQALRSNIPTMTYLYKIFFNIVLNQTKLLNNYSFYNGIVSEKLVNSALIIPFQYILGDIDNQYK